MNVCREKNGESTDSKADRYGKRIYHNVPFYREKMQKEH